MSIAMTREEREAFLAGVHVGIVSVAEEGRGPLAVPVWYAYEPGGEVWFLTGRSSMKGRLLERARRLSFCVQVETSPYRYVSVEGPVVGIEPAELERDRRPMARRYLGVAGGDRFIERTSGDYPDNVVVRMRPERWLTADYSKMGRG